MTKQIKFKTVPCGHKGNGKACYRAIPVFRGSVDLKTLAEHAAVRTGMDAGMVKFVAELLLEQVSCELSQGFHVDVRNFIHCGIAVEGVFEAADSPWDGSKHRLVPYFTAMGRMKRAFDDVTGENVTDGARCRVKRVLDTIAKAEGVITNARDVTVYISGVNLSVDSAAGDEGVWLENAEGEVVAKAAVRGSTATTVDCTFPTLPLAAAGRYKLVVATRGGLGRAFGVSIARRGVTLRSN